MKKIFIIFLVLGILLCASGAVLGYKYLLTGLSIKEFDENVKDNDVIYINGKINSKSVLDDELKVEVESSCLYREVMVVQTINDQDGEKLVLSNYLIDGNEEYNGEIKSKLFTNNPSINGLVISDDVMSTIYAYARYNNRINNVEVVNGDEAKKYGLSLINGKFVTASNEWGLGDIEVSYSSLCDVEFSVIATYKDGKAIVNEFTDAGSFTLDEAKINIISQGYLYDGLFVSGLIFIIISLAVKGKAKKNA